MKKTIVFLVLSLTINAQQITRVLPKEINDVLINPGIGFTTFQRFNGDSLNVGLKWTEGLPIEHQSFKGELKNVNHPMTSIAYFRIYWKYIEPEQGKYNWEIIENAIQIAQSRKQTLMLRIAPYGSGKEPNDPTDIPVWLRKMIGDRNEWLPAGDGWRIDAEDPKYAKYFGDMIAALGKRFDGHPGLEAVDLSIVGFWGEGRGSEILSEKTRKRLVNAYTNNFKKTPLLMLLTDEETNKYGRSQADVGWRVDCLGDMGGFSTSWSHMMDYYPQGIINFGMQDAWKKAPISLESCWVMQKWYDEGWDIDYIIDQSLKWHISSFNSKSSPVPKEWGTAVDRWLKKMGYRFVLRNISYSSEVLPNGKVSFNSWWENKGVAPCYKDFTLAFKLESDKNEQIFITDVKIKEWLPGDIVYDNSFFIPNDFLPGEYDLKVAIIDKMEKKPKVNLAIEGRDAKGWYYLGKIRIKN